MNSKKIIFLSLALLLPIGVFLFLKFFGKNHFDVPPVHRDSVAVSSNCNFKYRVPYVLPDSIMLMIWNDGKPQLSILNFSVDESVLKRVAEEFSKNDVQVVNAESDSLLSKLFIRECILLLKAPADIILIDSEKKIRGYYTGNDREEIDRLLTEASIILKKY